MKKVVTLITFMVIILSFSACRSTCSCASNEKQEINKNQTELASTDQADV